jgi:hypothetical protein
MCGTEGAHIYNYTNIKAVVPCGVLGTSSKGFQFFHVIQ